MWTVHRLARRSPSKEKFVDLHQLLLKGEDRKQGWLRRSCADELVEKNVGLYEELASKKLKSRVKEAIEKDLDRTVPVMKGDKKEALRRMLRALASLLHDIGYVQGLNYLAATLLYHTENECHAFWILVQLFKRYSFTDYYCRGMPGLFVFFDLLQQGLLLHAPRLAQHFSDEGVQTNMFSMKWALTLFGCRATIEHTAAIMDIFLYVGWDFVISLSLALLVDKQDEICQLPAEDILVLMETIPTDFDFERILNLTSLLMHLTQKWKLKHATSHAPTSPSKGNLSSHGPSSDARASASSSRSSSSTSSSTHSSPNNSPVSAPRTPESAGNSPTKDGMWAE